MTVAFIDTETLGLDADVHPIWEIGLILPNGQEFTRQIEVTPRELSLAHPMALEISGFEKRYQIAQDTERPEEIAEWLWNVIPAGTHLAGAVVSFDEERLRRLLWRFGYTPPWHYHIIDVEAMAVGFAAGTARCGGKGWLDGPSRHLPWDSEELSRFLDVEPERFDRHTALGDARWAKAIYEAVMTP